MGSNVFIRNNLNSGEITPRVYGRTDLVQYQNGLKTCKNAVVLPHGGVVRRPGFEYIGETETMTEESRLIPFVYSDEQAYILEFGDEYMRVWADGGQVYDVDSETVLLLHGNGRQGSQYIVDGGSTGHTIAVNGDTFIDTSIQKFGTGSIYFDGTGDYLSVADHANWNMGSSEVAFDGWVRFSSVTGKMCFYSQGADTNYVAFLQDHDNSKLYFLAMSSGSRVVWEGGTWSPSANTWYHIAVVRGWGSDTDDWAITVGGSAIHTFTNSGTLPDVGAAIQIGNMSKTVAVDWGDTGHGLTANGEVTISTSAEKYGTASSKFDPTGNNDYWTIADHADWDLQTNFTIDLWVKHTDHVGDEVYVAHVEDGNNKWIFQHVHGTGLQFFVQSAAANIVTLSGGEIADTDWHHVAMCKVGNEYGLYLDGTQTAYISDSDTDTFAGELMIGAQSGGADPHDGYIDDIRIYHGNPFSAAPNGTPDDTITTPTTAHTSDSNTKLLLDFNGLDFAGRKDEFRVSKGAARWTTNFTPPTSPYPIDLSDSGGGDIYEIATPYSSGHLAKLKYAQSADTMYIVHPSFAPRKLIRGGHASWTLSEVVWTGATSAVADQWPPFQNINTTTTTLDSAATTGNDIALVASAALFTADWVGVYIKMKSGLGLIDSVTDSTNATWDIIDDLTDHNATADWYAAAWSPLEGYPRSVSFHENRLAFGGCEGQPETVWLSKSGDYENFDGDGSAADDAVTYSILSDKANAIRWMVSLRKLIVGTSASEWWIAGGTNDEPLDGSDVPLVRRDTTLGVADIRPELVNNAILFTHDNERKLFKIGYSFDQDAYGGTDLSIFGEHLTKDYTITSIAYQQSPYQILWCVRSDGALLGFTYMPEHEVFAWHQHDTGASGEFESIAVIPGDTEDELWAIVKRTIDSSTVRYVERLSTFEFGGAMADARYADSYLVYDDTAATTITGLDHLEGETVEVLGDGVVQTSKAVSSGEITITSASEVCAGLEYTTQIETLRLDLGKGGGDTIQGRKKQIKKMTARFYETLSCQGGPDSSNLKDFSFEGSSTPYEEDVELRIPTSPNYDGTVLIQMAEPGPMTLLAIIYELELF
jgi:hypothetical protein